MLTLLSCPFCGANELSTIGPTTKGLFYVACLACGANGAKETRMECAAAAWNRRPLAPAVFNPLDHEQAK